MEGSLKGAKEYHDANKLPKYKDLTMERGKVSKNLEINFSYCYLLNLMP